MSLAGLTIHVRIHQCCRVLCSVHRIDEVGITALWSADLNGRIL